MSPTTPISHWIATQPALAWDLLLRYPTSKSARRWAWALLGLLFVAGVFWWGIFYRWGHYPMDFQDWIDVSAPRFFFLRDAALRLILPLHVTDKALLGWATFRYMAVPDAFLSPQFILLRFISVERFIFLDIVGMYSLGFVGLLCLRKRFSLSIAAFSLLFFLFNFNGHILAHLSIGHETWGGYFLFPWFVLLVLDLLDGDASWGWVAKVSGLLFVMLLQGSYHQMVWCLFGLGFVSVAKKGVFLPALKAAVATVLLSAVRLLPVTLETGIFDQSYHGGFVSFTDLVGSLTTLAAPGQYVTSPLYYKVLGNWEFTLYIGLAGAIFLAFFGVYRWLTNRESEKRYFELLLPILGLSLLSFHGIFLLLRRIPFPMFSGERVPARIISLPFVFLLVLAAVEFQRWLNQERAERWLPLVVWAGLLAVSLHDLWVNLISWSIFKVQPLFEHGMMFYSKWVVSNDPNDQPYYQMLVIGAIVSLLSLGLLLGLIWRERRLARQSARLQSELPPEQA
jgi:hypothetical protein